jgi:hypothetical protein
MIPERLPASGEQAAAVQGRCQEASTLRNHPTWDITSSLCFVSKYFESRRGSTFNTRSSRLRSVELLCRSDG